MGRCSVAAALLALVCAAAPVFCQTETEPPPTTTKQLSTKVSSATTTPAPPASVTWGQQETPNEGQAIQKAIEYLLEHRQPDWGWGNDTHHVMLTLQVRIRLNAGDRSQR
ncbi:hypothetical protein JYU34_012272 [Plutella xylostella]|uniref:Uncharacterized protein n=1 Tax=Plutella xylostella TaxID=51655 RepID=A0ABQ7QIF1_PLUXY|nr:hypothetical protein JYU34_012272 [Plutella xylostella]